MDETEVLYEEIDSRQNFVFDISLKNLLDYNGFLRRYQDSPYTFEIIIGIIELGDFYQIGPSFRKDIQPMIISQWDQI
jgi:hypothetical protein